MFEGLMLSYAVVHAFLFIESFRWADNSQWRIWFLRLMLFGMAYDNLLQGLGFLFIDQYWFELANYPRYYLHVLVLPFLTLFTLSIMREARVAIASRPWFVGFCLVFTLSALIYGSYHELTGLEIAANDGFGVVRFKKLGDSIPHATILTNIYVLALAIAVWRVSGWKWLFLGGLFILLLNGATGAQPWGFATGNFAEVVFIFALLRTERHFSHRRV